MTLTQLRFLDAVHLNNLIVTKVEINRFQFSVPPCDFAGAARRLPPHPHTLVRITSQSTVNRGTYNVTTPSLLFHIAEHSARRGRLLPMSRGLRQTVCLLVTCRRAE